MSGERLSLALGLGDALPSEGRILVIGPRAGTDLSGLDPARVTAEQGFRPDHDALAALGYTVVPEAQGSFSAALIFLPRARDAGRALVARAAQMVLPGAPIWIDGQKTDGVDTMLRDLRARAAVDAPLSKAHGKIFRLANPGPAALADWRAQDLQPLPGFVTVPGVFSSDHVDPGSAALADALPHDLHGRIADLGAGWGWLAVQILARPAVTELHLIEADHAALGCARRNVADPRARFHWADATRFHPDRPFDVVVMNPPFHVARAADPGLGLAFIRAAASMLTPAGHLWMVANRHLPYEAALTQAFRKVTEIGAAGGFKVIHAAAPTLRARPRA